MSGQVITGHPYSVTDIQHYLEGRLSVAEMHAIESAALDDPFLADAIDGVSENLHVQPPGYFDADMDDLKRRLQERIASKRSVIVLSSNSTWWKAAAAVIIVLAASAITFNYFVRNSAPPPDIVLNNSTAKADSAVAQHQPEPAADASDQPQDEKINSSANRKIIAAIPSAKKTSGIVAGETPDKDSFSYHRSRTITPQVQSDSVALAYAPVHPSGDSITKDVDNQLQGNVSGLTVDKASSRDIILLKGRVIGQAENAIPGAIVSIGRDRKTTAADAQGNFTLPVNRSDTGVDLLVTAVGYDSKSLSLHPAENAETTVKLQPSSVSLNEVVVTGLGVSHRKSKSIASETTRSNAFKAAAPVEGWDAFKKYMDENKQIVSPDSVLRGNEVLSFNVNAQGNLSHFSVSQSISPAHDAKIIGLLKKGPKWRLLSGNKARVTLSISY